MNQQDDILGSFNPEDSGQDFSSDPVFMQDEIIFQDVNIIEKEEITQDAQENIIAQSDESVFETLQEAESDTATVSQIEQKSVLRKALGTGLFMTKYLTTSVCIFAVLMVASNYSAYFKIAQSIIYADEMQNTKQSLIESVAASEINESSTNKAQTNTQTFRNLTKSEEQSSVKKVKPIHDISEYAAVSTQNIDLGIEITPYENRIIIPKIGKNIPLLDIKQTKVEGVDELNEIFMKDLENGVIRYPGSAKPGEKGNSFIFGHSSNFPWMDGDYNDVFALLDKVVFDDEVVVYYGQEKHTYKIRTKDVIRPSDVSVLRNNLKDDRSQITLMTCWPIGTTLNRLVLTGDLVKVEKK